MISTRFLLAVCIYFFGAPAFASFHEAYKTVGFCRPTAASGFKHIRVMDSTSSDRAVLEFLRNVEPGEEAQRPEQIEGWKIISIRDRVFWEYEVKGYELIISLDGHCHGLCPAVLIVTPSIGDQTSEEFLCRLK
jgi:hypothetical protein